ncbi:hypothetical protein [Sphingobium yanoikuyae]|uniref:hypothetical protein n=1 Tax=Sphingobium yanoikuyae TaxID=13690 RepID=UPI0028AA5C77|nr:hypothetical protein [Sphingobium yanoikuyae]
MITDKQNNAGPIEWADYVIQAAARIANAGSMFGYEKIVAARIWLAGHNARLLGDAADHRWDDQTWWSRTKRDQLSGALDEWENEGGGLLR